MNRTRFYGAVILMVVGAAAVACDGADPDADADAAATSEQQIPQPEMDQETAERLMEIQSIQQQLQPIQQQALQDPELAGQLQEIQARVEAAMREENPELIERSTELQGELADAQAAGDQDRMQELMVEAQGLQQELQVAQGAVLERPDIRGPVDEFEAAQRQRMIEIDPEAEELLDRMDELIAELSDPA